MNKILLFLIVCFLSACATPNKEGADKVLVEKSLNQMHLIDNGEIIRTYKISLGGNPIGHKVQEGDLRTPEGHYNLIYKNDKSKFYRSITISYPNERDVYYARMRGVDPGGGIVIHGFPNTLGNVAGPFQPLNWTEGCIAVRNWEMDELFELVALDTPIEIRP